uniref:Uncharacterized protein n=1 Tax=Vitis vinifera TaxID=29760 RepID=F6I779_VITVI
MRALLCCSRASSSRWLISNTDHYQRGLGLLCNDDFVLRLVRNYPRSAHKPLVKQVEWVE